MFDKIILDFTMRMLYIDIVGNEGESHDDNIHPRKVCRSNQPPRRGWDALNWPCFGALVQSSD